MIPASKSKFSNENDLTNNGHDVVLDPTDSDQTKINPVFGVY
jgi:hypothetical protein